MAFASISAAGLSATGAASRVAVQVGLPIWENVKVSESAIGGAELGYSLPTGPREITVPLGGENDPSITGFNSYSGADIQIALLVRDSDRRDTGRPIKNYVEVAELQTISISSARSKFPVRRLGESHTTAWTSGARTIAGSMVFATSSRDVLAAIASVSRKEHTYGRSVPGFLADELPPFMVLLRAANEYGHMAHAALVGVEISNFGTIYSVDDLYTEASYSYVAKYYYPLVRDPVKFMNDLDPEPDSTHESISAMAMRAPPIDVDLGAMQTHPLSPEQLRLIENARRRRR